MNIFDILHMVIEVIMFNSREESEEEAIDNNLWNVYN